MDYIENFEEVMVIIAYKVWHVHAYYNRENETLIRKANRI
jgi:hypothetical protein